MHPILRAAAIVAAISVAAATCGGSPSGPAPVCSIAISPSTADFGSTGGTGTVTVSAPAGCSWNATAGASWITITGGASGSGPGTVTYTLSTHTGTDQRTAPVTVAGQTLTVRQQGRTAASCTYSLSPERQDYGPESGSGAFAVSTAAECTWSATADAPWIVITSGAQGSGDGTVTYTVGANGSVAGRGATISVADRTFEVRQAGDVSRCEYSLAPVQFDPCMPGGTVQAALTTQASCPWTATPNASWISLPGGGSGSGSVTITMAFPDNYDAPREGLVMVRWPTPTAGQNVRIAQAGCTYSVSQADFSFTSNAATGSFMVLQQSIPTACGGATQDRCVWTAVSSVPWITITSSMPRAGDHPVGFAVAANNTSQPRTGQITVRDRVVTITQARQ